MALLIPSCRMENSLLYYGDGQVTKTTGTKTARTAEKEAWASEKAATHGLDTYLYPATSAGMGQAAARGLCRVGTPAAAAGIRSREGILTAQPFENFLELRRSPDLRHDPRTSRQRLQPGGLRRRHLARVGLQ
jgi:hypothetical protein